jgi:hypothetical protein
VDAGDYRVMHWHSAMDGPWSPEAERRFREGGFDGLMLVPDAQWHPPSLAFLHDLPGLRMLNYTGKVTDDLDAFRVDTLEDLTLVTGARRKLPDVTQPHLRRLCLTDRPGLEVAARWPALAALRLGTWRGTDLELLAGAKDLSKVHIEGRRQAGSLAGIDSCPAVETLIMINYSVRDTTSLRGLRRLTEARLMATRPTPPHHLVDLSDLAGPSLATLWISNAGEIRGVEALAGPAGLRQVRLLECRLRAEARQILAELPRRVTVEVLDR